jgi:hypothetical protein
MALGTRRADICIVLENQKYPIELKILKDKKSVPEGLVQLSKYMDKCVAKEGWLVVFDRNAERSWDEKLYSREVDEAGRKIAVFGC